jgi:hypothetical protein
MPECLCCHDPLLRHIEGKQLRWFCRRCWQFMPASMMESPKTAVLSEAIAPSLPPSKVAKRVPVSPYPEAEFDRSGKFVVKPTFKVSRDSTSQFASAID